MATVLYVPISRALLMLSKALGGYHEADIARRRCSYDFNECKLCSSQASCVGRSNRRGVAER